MPTAIYDIEVRCFAQATGVRIALNPKLVTRGLVWSFVEHGGMEMATVPIAVPFEQVPVTNGDWLEIWALNAGETVPRWRGIVNVGERRLMLAEQHVITAYGRMEDMAHVVVDKVVVHPNSLSGTAVNPGADLSVYAADLLADYLARKALGTSAYQPTVVSDCEMTGVNIQTLDATLSTARAAMDSLTAQAGVNAVWGWDIDPLTGNDRFYIRPRSPSAVGSQFFIGSGVQEVTAPTEYQALANTAWIKGGPALYPNLLQNPSFELPTVPTASAGNLLGDGSFEASGASSGFTDGWSGASGATLANHNPSNNWNFSAHTGEWCVTLGYVNAAVMQTVAATPGTEYVASVYARREDGTYANAGQLIVYGLNASNAVVETYTLPFAPPSTAWTGGQASTVLGGTAIQMPVVFQSSTVTQAKVEVIATNAGSATQNLIIDDVLFAEVGSVGTVGWGTHVETPGNAGNAVLSVDWVNTSLPWDGWYCVRLNTLASSTYSVYLAPLPEPGTSGGAEFETGGYQMKPTAGMALTVGVRVRMSPGLAAAAGSVGIEYRSHAADGHENQFVAATITAIPNDGNWHYVSTAVSVHGDTVLAVAQLRIETSDWYDVDGWSARDTASGELGNNGSGVAYDPSTAGYLRGTAFEAVVDVTNANVISAGLSTLAQASINTYGRREAVVSNKNLVAIDGQFWSWVATWLNQFAVPIARTRITLADEQVQQPNPGAASLVRVSGTSNDIPDQFTTKTTYTWTGRLQVEVELTTQRPSLDKLLLSAAAAAASSVTSSTGAALASSSSGAPTTAGSATQPQYQIDAGLVPIGTTLTLSQSPINGVVSLYLLPSGQKIAQSEISSVAANVVTLASGLPTGATGVDAVYLYSPAST